MTSPSRFAARLLVGLLATAGLAAHATDFRSTDIHPDGYPTVEAVKYMGTVLSKLTNGKHSIKVFNKGALGSEKETIDQTKIGALDFTRVNISPMNAICPKTQVPTMPFLFRSVEHMRKVLDGRWATRSSRTASPTASSVWRSMTRARARSTARRR